MLIQARKLTMEKMLKREMEKRRRPERMEGNIEKRVIKLERERRRRQGEERRRPGRAIVAVKTLGTPLEE